jgi:hypothetical protein
MPNNSAPLTDGDPSAPGALRIPANSVLVIPTCKVQGGRSTTSTKLREDEEGNRVETAREVVVVIEDKDERERAEKLASAGVYQIRRCAHSTPVGYVTTTDRIAEIEAGLSKVRGQVATFNGSARHSHVQIGYLAIPLSVDLGPEVAKALADGLREGFERARDAIRTGKPEKVQSVLTGIQNAHELCTGVMRESALLALDQVKDAIRYLREEGKRGVAEPSAGASYVPDMIEAAIGLFSY